MMMVEIHENVFSFVQGWRRYKLTWEVVVVCEVTVPMEKRIMMRCREDFLSFFSDMTRDES